jgi:hypothetical protein
LLPRSANEVALRIESGSTDRHGGLVHGSPR